MKSSTALFVVHLQLEFTVCFEFRDSYFVLPRPLAVVKKYDFPHHIKLPFQVA